MSARHVEVAPLWQSPEKTASHSGWVEDTIAALGHSHWEVRADKLQQLLGLEGPELSPFAEAVLPLVADPSSEVRRRACELVHKLELPVLHNLKDIPTDSRMSFLRCGKTWKCLCVPGSMPAPPPSPPPPPPLPESDAHVRCSHGTPSYSAVVCGEYWPSQAIHGFGTPCAVGHDRLPNSGERGSGAPHPLLRGALRQEADVEWLGTLVNAPDLWELAGQEHQETKWYHWKVRDALAFNVRDLQGTALVRLLTDAEAAVREDALIALRRLPSSLWAHHTRWVTQCLVDPVPEVRMAALCALQRLSYVELALQARFLNPPNKKPHSLSVAHPLYDMYPAACIGNVADIIQGTSGARGVERP